MNRAITISRQYGSGGREIGEAVAKKLGIPCYDKCLIQKAAQEAGLSETAVAEYDEKGEDFGIAVSGNALCGHGGIKRSVLLRGSAGL